MYSIYILRWARTHLTYVGMTKNPEQRLRKHRSGKDGSTKNAVAEFGRPYMEILASNLTPLEAEQLEAYYIEELNTHSGHHGEGFNKARMFDTHSRVKKSRFIT